MSATERPISTVLHDIVRNLQEIVRSEIHLAKTELREELTRARAATMLMAVGVASAFFSAFFALLTLVYALSLVIPAWTAALCVTVAVALIAGLTLPAALKRYRAIHAGVPKAAASVKENVEWARQQIR